MHENLFVTQYLSLYSKYWQGSNSLIPVSGSSLWLPRVPGPQRVPGPRHPLRVLPLRHVGGARLKEELRRLDSLLGDGLVLAAGHVARPALHAPGALPVLPDALLTSQHAGLCGQ